MSRCMDEVLEAFQNCITDRKCENRDCPYESRCQIANGKDQYFQIPKHLAFDVARILSYLLKEQEPVEPDKPEEVWLCGNCGEIVGWYDWVISTDDVRHKYCPKCGRRVKWR